MPEEKDVALDATFLAGIKDELASIEENEKNIQALSQVFRYYAKHAKQLSQVLFDFATKQCFPWELIHALHLVDDILLMDNTGRYKAALIDRMQVITVGAFKKVQSEAEKKEVARMLHAWGELKIFEATVLDPIRASIRSGGARAGEILDEAAVADEDDEDFPAMVSPVPAGSPLPEGSPVQGENEICGNDAVPKAKKPKVAESADGTADKTVKDVNPKPAVVAKVAVPSSERVNAIMGRILRIPIERPFEVLGIVQDGSSGHDIRKAYRRIALLIHPDKNPGNEVQCGEALSKLQQAREQAESDLQRFDNTVDASRGNGTRSEATAAAAYATVDTSFKCKYPGCDLAPCKQCANGCCQRNITHCHMIARSKAGLQCFFHPPPRAWARNAE